VNLSEIVKLEGAKPGPTLAIFAGVHGNETAGVLALQELISNLKISRGTLFLAFANPPAIKANVRMISKNMNRCFMKNNDGTTFEDERARELMSILDGCDALLDLHMFYDDNGSPFVICEDNAFDVAKIFDVDIISTNWTKVEPGGTDGYMFLNNKIGICVECGPISKANEYKAFATKTIYQFLKFYNMTKEEVVYSDKPKRIVKANKAIHKSSDKFTLVDGYRNFDPLKAGQLIASDETQTYIAKTGECIIFPHYAARVGEEAYIIGTES